MTTGVKDRAGNALAQARTWTFTTKAADPAPQQAIRINAGGAAQDVSGVVWSACSSTSNCSGYLTGGFPYGKANAITGVAAPANNALYQSGWTGRAESPGQILPSGAVAFAFDVPVGNGSYNVRLHFAELVHNGVGKRVFDVNVEGGAKELAGFDVFAEAGGMNRAIVREFPATVSDGKMDIDFIRQVENVRVSAIEILPVASPSPAPAASSLSLDASASTVKIGQATTLSGQLLAGARRRPARRSSWKASPTRRPPGPPCLMECSPPTPAAPSPSPAWRPPSTPTTASGSPATAGRGPPRAPSSG